MINIWKNTAVCLVNGYRYDTRLETGEQYETITLGEVFGMANRPHRADDKGRALAVILSTYCEYDARDHAAQEARGSYAALWADIDEGNHSLQDVVSAVRQVAASDNAWLIYSTYSAAEEAPRWRVIIPLQQALPFEPWQIAQKALATRLAKEGIAIDSCGGRSGQLAILPVHRPFYETESNVSAQALDVDADWLVLADYHQAKERQAKVETMLKEASEKIHKARDEGQQRAKRDSSETPIDWFNKQYSITALLSEYGYKQKRPSSSVWRSPYQTSGSYATRDFGNYWVSLSGSDAAKNIGRPCSGGQFGDAFDLYAHFEHNGNDAAAVRTVGAMMPLASAADFDDLPTSGDEPIIPLTADDLSLGGRALLRKAINAEGKATPSGAAYSLAVAALKEGLNEDEVKRILLTPENRVSQHCLKAATPLAEAQRVIDWAVKTMAASRADKFDEEESPPATALEIEDFYFIAPQGSCIYLPTRELWPTKTIDGAFKRKLRDASDWFAENRLAEQMVWAPGEPQVIANRLMAAGSWQEMPGATVINTYLPGPSLAGGDPTKAGPWVDLIKRVYPNETDHLIDCFAQRVQRPQDKINHAIVLGGQQGIGKDSMLEPVKEAIGHWNWADISPTHAMGRFNGFLKSIVLRISEARDLGDHDRFAFYDRAKTWMAAPPDVHTIDEKNRREYPAQNVTFVIITTNRQDALHLEPDDRRHFVAWSDLSKEDFSADYWAEYYDWLNKAGGRAHVAAFLRQRDIISFDPKAPPPKTPAFWAILQAGQSPETIELSDVLEEMGWPDVVCSQAIAAEAGIDTLLWFSDPRHAKKVRYRLSDCGYETVLNPSVQDGRWRFEGGSKRMIYVRRSISPSERVKIASHYARYGAGF
jgi:hypothetical protein